MLAQIQQKWSAKLPRITGERGSQPEYAFELPLIEQSAGDDDKPLRHQSFTLAVVALAARLARVDGDVQLSERLAFKALFSVAGGQRNTLDALFDEEKQDTRPYTFHARSIQSLYHAEPKLLAEVLDRLIKLANADGPVTQPEMEYLTEVARIFGYSRESFRTLLSRHIIPAESDPYTVLGVTKQMSLAEIKQAYRRQLREYHPDGLVAYDVPQDIIEMATRRVSALNEAWAKVQSKHK